MPDFIRVVGARQHNLKNVSITVPRHALTVFTGLSGSGKSSLAHDTIFQEGQRRYVESLSSYARQFLGQMDRPDVDHLEGLSPAISIDQGSGGRSPRSTVGTVTEIYSLYRLLMARLGTPHCPKCGRTIAHQTAERIALSLLDRTSGEPCLVMAPIVHQRKGEYRKELAELKSQGFVRVRVDGTVRRLDEPIELARYERHTIEVVVDRIELARKNESRLLEGVERALEVSDGRVSFLIGEDRHELHGTERACPECGITVPEQEPNLFSFNAPAGACPECNGLGETLDFVTELVVPDPTLSVREGALKPLSTEKGTIPFSGFGMVELEALADRYEIDLDRPWKEMAVRERKILLEGSGEDSIEYSWTDGDEEGEANKPLLGVVTTMKRIYAKWRMPHYEKFMRRQECSACGGRRLRAEALAVRFRERSIDQLAAMTIADADAFFRGVQLEGNEALVGREIFKEIGSRLGFLAGLGLGYLSLDRRAGTLAGGEMQRIRLARQLGSGLQGILYILDEPSIGLHHRDNDRLIDALLSLRDQGNTIFVIEHDEDTMRAADHLVDIGPGAGIRGGEVVAQGTPAEVERDPKSLTAGYLSRRLEIAMPEERRQPAAGAIRVEGARHHNLKDVDVDFPLGVFTAVTGVSGSGKSTLVNYILKRALFRQLHGEGPEPGLHRRVTGLEAVDKVIEIDQSPIGRTPRSNPATYVKVFDLIRDLYAGMPLSKIRGYDKGRFSFNKKGGRCEACEGAGVQRIEMQFFAPVEVVCDDCQGLRYGDETLEVLFRDRSIQDVLGLTVDEAVEFFANQPKIHGILTTLQEVGLGYVGLGQPSTTLSGGEAQRIKLTRELRRPPTGKTFYLLDEPTTGLHFEDVQRLIDCLQRLVDKGNSVLVIEHNLDVIKVADWVVDLGPEGGAGGGEVLYAGPFDGILECAGSYTAKALARHLGRTRTNGRGRAPAKANRAAERDLVIRGASRNNLKKADVRIPTGSLTVVTGVSGSGKSSLVLDTIFTEGQRRFVESLSTYARRFVGRLDRSPVDSIEGLAPAIAIDQKAAPPNPRSTVATVTEIYDNLRLLYSRIGRPHCPQCGKRLREFTPGQAARDAAAQADGRRVRVLAPLFLAGAGVSTPFTAAADLARAAEGLRGDGFLRVAIDGEERRLDEPLPDLDEVREIHLVLDRLVLGADKTSRLATAIESAYEKASGLAFVTADGGEVLGYSRRPGCTECHYYQKHDPIPRLFSFNHHAGACPGCEGLGERMEAAPDRVLPDPDAPLLDGALAAPIHAVFARKAGHQRAVLQGLAEELDFDLGTPVSSLPARIRKVLLEGRGGREVEVVRSRNGDGGTRTWSYRAAWPGLLALALEQYEHSSGGKRVKALEALFDWSKCRECGGDRLKRESLAVLVGDRSIADVCRMTVAEAREFFTGLKVAGSESKIARQVLDDVRNRLEFLASVGLHYLTLDRRCGTLTGGEAQRIRLATQLGSRLAGVLYCLDEPTIGLHPRDIDQLVRTLEGMRDLGNTVVVVEHDEDVMRRADFLVDIGPGAGSQGGEVVAKGKPDAVARSKKSLTGQFLSGARRIALPPSRRPTDRGEIVLRGVRHNNLKGFDASFPTGCLVAVTGVSGSGKSSLVLDCLAQSVQARLEGAAAPANHDEIDGLEAFEKVVLIDQHPIGRSPKSNPATYVGLMDKLRLLFAEMPEARRKGFGKCRFSFNVAGGRCETCEGRGQIQIEMHFLSDVWVTCEDCQGKRYNRETLAVRFKGLSIADVLVLDVAQAREFFSAQTSLQAPLALLQDVGLGYLRLGQSATTLSGGEAQRLKLATELAARSTGRTLYVLDEPTTGLHLADVDVLLRVLHRLADQGNTVVVVEHQMDVVANADWVLDLGPEGGDGGGELVFAGRPEDLAACRRGHTARFLARRLDRSRSLPAAGGTS